MLSTLLLTVALLGQIRSAPASVPLLANTPLRVDPEIPAPGDPPILVTPAGLVDLALADLKASGIPVNHYKRIRYLTAWPLNFDEADKQNLDVALRFWLASLNNNRINPPIFVDKTKLLFRIDIAQYGWDAQAWEDLGAVDPYFVPSTINKDGIIVRGNVDPRSFVELSALTQSAHPIMRADFFIQRTSVEVGGIGKLDTGFYSRFVKFPGTVAELFKLQGADIKLANDRNLVIGGAVLQSIVAQYNRELVLFPSQVGGLLGGAIWQSNDVAAAFGVNGNKSVVTSLANTIAKDGGEFIMTMPNGLHGYYLANAAGAQLSEVPINIAQDKEDQFEKRVLSPWKCVSCHTPRSGIINFEDVVRQMIQDKSGLILIHGKAVNGQKLDEAAVEKLQDTLRNFYTPQLKPAIKLHQDQYAYALSSVVPEMKYELVAQRYLAVIHGYRYQPVSSTTVEREIGIPAEETRNFLGLIDDPHAVAILSGLSVHREVWEAVYQQFAQGRIYPWEENLLEFLKARKPTGGRVDKFQIPTGAVVVAKQAGDAEGTIRFNIGSQSWLVDKERRSFKWDGSKWVTADIPGK